MKVFICVFVIFFGFKAFAQEPTYNQVLEKEILSNSFENSQSAMSKPYVIMVSIDGFRYDYAQKYQAQNILDIAKEGSTTLRMIPAFPSKTFPNHYTIVTGLYPEHHGIVSNSFYDKATKKGYSISNTAAVQDGSWYGGIPLWNLAQMQGMTAASYFWVGSEADINGIRPKYYYPYLKASPYEYRIQRIMEWLKMPEKIRPHFITLYFSLVDTQGHDFGPDSKETEASVLYVDKQIGALREGIKKSGLPITLIVTSDHGMDNINKLVNIHDYVQLDKSQFFNGPVAMIYTKDTKETDEMFEKLSGKSNFRVYKRAGVPSYLNYSNNEKIGDLVLVCDPPYTIIYSEKEVAEDGKPGGTHGYDPFEHKNMGTIFYAEGPQIKKGFVLAPFENIHLYPLVAHLLELKLMSPIDGKLEATSEILKKD